MANADHIILCGGAPAPRRPTPKNVVRLDLGGDEPNVDLEIDNISRRLSTDVPDILTDLVEIASYVYCADQAVTRGGEGVLVFGAKWRRNFIFHIPVRRPSIWSSPNVLHSLQKTLAILSEDNYEFQFVQRINAVPMQQYLTLGAGDSTTQELDEVLLFSGGLDSLGGTVQEAVLDKRRVALVSHRSNSKVFSRQKKLVAGLHASCKENPPIHVPVWVHQSGTEGREYTQRSRTFLYASLGATVARVFGLKRIRFYENGVISLNLPISEQVVGARATRTTHPQVLDGFASLFGHLVEETFTVENPFLWITKTEVVNLIGDAGCGDLIGQSVSCTHTREQTTEKPHCGRCSQCISRKFATLASRYPLSDPDSTTYVAAIEPAEEFGLRLYTEAWRRGWSKARKKVVLGDGAIWIWNLAAQHFPGAIQIVDLYHARQHIWELAGKLFPNEEQARKQWTAICLDQLDEGKIEALVKILRDLHPSNEKVAEAVHNDADYFQRNAERMRYPRFRAQGLFVGSGVIEAGCRTVIGARLKRSGMFWSVRGANAIIALRCCRLSGRFEDYWESRSRAA